MKTIDMWFEEYGVSHKNSTNQIIHFVCVPLIMFSVFGLLWSLPQISVFKAYSFINWATLFYFACLIFYITLDKLFTFLMTFIAGLMLVGVYYLSKTPYLIEISLSIFVLSWIGQFVGHKIEGKKPSFFKDLQFLLIGPLWVLEEILGLRSK